MDATITVTIPARWAQDLSIDQGQLRQALMLGLAQLRSQRTPREATAQTTQVLLSTGRVRRLSAALVSDGESDIKRQPPPTLPGPPVSEILLAQRRGEL